MVGTHRAAFAGDVVAAAVLLHRGVALGARLGVGRHPHAVLALATHLALPLLPPAPAQPWANQHVWLTEAPQVQSGSTHGKRTMD